MAIIIQINANCNLHTGLRTISQQRVSRKIRDTVYQRIRILHFRDKLLFQSRKNQLQQNAPILVGRLQIRTILHKINIQQNERTKLFFNNNISKTKPPASFVTLTKEGSHYLKTKIMNKVITILTIALLTTIVNAQEKKSKTYNQSRSAKTGRYVTSKVAQTNPSTTYSTKRRK